MADDNDQVTSIESLATRDPGSDEVVYDDVEELPRWWRKAIEEHESFGLRPYQPPQFADETIMPPIVDQLETEYNVKIQLRGKNVSPGDNWTVLVDGSPAFDVSRRRDPNGYTVVEISYELFIERIKAYLDD